ncbi:signal recognition particle-docking protein FtsY [Oceanivirga miroungae]|uniref:Signal recognition particle receptor FtsY n=1 Tax=Oceanivirga miroungae TaxID=1130046 RepID=A0A6I8MDG2_9FUSO|nr:signal recognition particle-docking protein FtsY [Oceanivirga miroungae]VWL85204.1 flagellar biosynthesis regulator FlhF [Oceanivirga miroungae]
MAILKAKEGFFKKLKHFFISKPIDDDLYEELEELLISSDMGVELSVEIIEELESRKYKNSQDVYDALEEILISKLESVENNLLHIEKNKLNIIFVIGVNGVGKTTSIGKIANQLKNEGYKLVLGAADTFRAAAIDQLNEWANRVNCKMISHNKGTDPAAVVYDTISYATKENVDIAIIDTAGRLQNKKNLMEELRKISSIIEEKAKDANKETLLVIDATTGQNGLNQAKIFNEITKIDGIILTKYDGTAKGGIIFPIISELKKPIKYIGVGEGINDLKPFCAKSFVKEIFEK